ncbi:MAG: hypothetical protein ACJ77M_19450 [Thermoleophilaceae bacterium]
MTPKALVCGVLATLALLLCAAAPAGAEAPGLPQLASGHRPGPDILYAPPADAPQLQNTGPWRAPPILVSGAEAYRGGEFMYQDFLNDDHGAAGIPDNNNPVGPNAFLYSPPAGTYTYPTNPAYANNAADLVEMRVKPLPDATAFRVTLDTLKDAGRTAFTIAIGNSAAALPWPHGAGVRSPAQYFLTVHGSTAELTNAVTGQALSPAPTATVDMTRRQIDVRVPHTAWDPGQSTVRMTIGVGLWDPSAGSYLVPQNGSATADKPGGGGAPSNAAIVNVGPRLNEPYPDPTAPPQATLADSAVWAAVAARSWRERNQADALQSGDVSGFHADVDFGKLAAGTDDDSAVPKTGPINRILASHYQFGQGLDPSKVCFDLGSNYSAGSKCIGRFVGQLQPYALYVPPKPQPPQGFGLTLLLHSLSANYNQYSSSRNQSELGNRGPGSLVVTPSGRGPDGFNAGIAEADTFEAWADVARHYKLDPDWTVTSGYSMGAFGSFLLAARWPDLFARVATTVGIPGPADDQLASLRNVPFMGWNATADELVRLPDSQAALEHIDATGLRFDHYLFPVADHLTLATNDEYGPQASFLGTARVERDPMHVSYVVDPTEDNSDAQAVANHAYWLSDLAVRNFKVPDPHTGTIDVRSEAFGTGDPQVLPVKAGGGDLEGGAHGPTPFVERDQEWGPVPKTPARDVLDVNATNIKAATIDVRRARVSCAAKLNVKSDGPINVTLAGCEAVQAASAGCVDTRRFSFKLHHYRRARVVKVQVFVNGKRRVSKRGRNIKSVAIRRLPQGTFKVKIVSTQSTGSRLVSTRSYKGCAKGKPKTRAKKHRRRRH